jgi:hypothetical protein
MISRGFGKDIDGLREMISMDYRETVHDQGG